MTVDMRGKIVSLREPTIFVLSRELSFIPNSISSYGNSSLVTRFGTMHLFKLTAAVAN